MLQVSRPQEVVGPTTKNSGRPGLPDGDDVIVVEVEVGVVVEPVVVVAVVAVVVVVVVVVVNPDSV